MRNLIIFGFLIILLLAAQFATAKTVDEIIERYIRARGGKDRLTTVKSICMRGIKEWMGKEVDINIVKERDKLYRIDISNDGANGFLLITGDAACTFVSGRSPAVEKIPREEMAVFETEMDIAGPMVDYIAKGHKAEMLGKDSVAGNTCYKIKITTKAGNEMFFWVDAATYLLNQSSCMISGGANGVERETLTVYKNYKEVDGIQFAHTCETQTNGVNALFTAGETVFHTILVNPAIESQSHQPE